MRDMTSLSFKHDVTVTFILSMCFPYIADAPYVKFCNRCTRERIFRRLIENYVLILGGRRRKRKSEKFWES